MWQIPLDQPPAGCDASQWPWLISPDSLTARLRQITDHKAKTTLLRAGWGEITAEEATWLETIGGGQTPSNVWAREIIHTHQQQPWIWGRTLIPAATIEKTGLDPSVDQSIGNILFHDPHLTRTALQLAQLPKNHSYFRHVDPYLSSPQHWLWARRSILWFKQQPLFIIELYLPDFFKFIA